MIVCDDIHSSLCWFKFVIFPIYLNIGSLFVECKNLAHGKRVWLFFKFSYHCFIFGMIFFYRIGIKTVFQMSIDDVVKITLINIELSLCFNSFIFSPVFRSFQTQIMPPKEHLSKFLNTIDRISLCKSYQRTIGQKSNKWKCSKNCE